MTGCPPGRVEWHKGPLLGFDLETSGVDVESDRTVTAALVYIEPGKPPVTINRLVNPGIDIPDEAAAIHGITTAHAFEHGEPPHAVLLDVVGCLADACKAAVPIVGMNLPYDFTLLDRDCRRHGVQPLVDVVEHIAPVVDVRILDKNADPFRKGTRKLTDLCAHYGVQLTEAHNSGADALGACRVAWKLAQMHPKFQIDLATLHGRQIAWCKNQFIGFRNHRQKTGNPLEGTYDGSWPMQMPLPENVIPIGRKTAS